MATTLSGMISFRSRAMSKVFLTGDLGVSVMDIDESGPLGGVDQVASLPATRHHLRRIFGVIISGTSRGLPDVEAAEKYVGQLGSKSKDAITRPIIPIPTIVAVFSMLGDKGYYAWRVEPVVDRATTRLQVHSHLTCHSTEGSAIKDVVEKVAGWYDAFKKTVIMTS